MASSRTVALPRGSQRISSGLGHHFVSPKKPRDKKKTQKSVKLPGVVAKRRRLLVQMEQLMNPEPQCAVADVHPVDTTNAISNMDDTDAMAEISDLDSDPVESPSITPLLEDLHDRRRTVPDKSTDMLYTSWKALIPSLVDPHLKYSARTLATALGTVPNVISACTTLSCPQKRTLIVCLFFDSKFSYLLAYPTCMINYIQDLHLSMS
jgi:hypothetical protein